MGQAHHMSQLMRENILERAVAADVDGNETAGGEAAAVRRGVDADVDRAPVDVGLRVLAEIADLTAGHETHARISEPAVRRLHGCRDARAAHNGIPALPLDVKRHGHIHDARVRRSTQPGRLRSDQAVEAVHERIVGNRAAELRRGDGGDKTHAGEEDGSRFHQYQCGVMRHRAIAREQRGNIGRTG